MTALLVGHFAGTYIMDVEMNNLLENNHIQLENQEEMLNQIDTTEAISRTLLSQIRLDSAQSAENDRTMFAYLDDIQEQLREINATMTNNQTTN